MTHPHKSPLDESGEHLHSRPGPFVEKIDRILGVLETLVPPAVFAEYIAHVCNVSEKRSAIIAVVAAGICAIIRWGWGVRHFFARQFAILISLALAVIVTIEYRQNRNLNKKVQELSARTYRDPDPQVDWAIHNRLTLQECAQKKEKEEDCFVRVLDSFPAKKPPDIVSDLRTASILKRDNPAFTEWLRNVFGIDDRVLGTGYSLMWSAKDYSDGHLSEYLSPNLPDTSPNLWTWNLTSSQFHGKSLRGILEKQKPLANNPERPDFKLMMRSPDFRRHLQLHDNMPVVVRFELLDPGHYTKCLGLHTARRVFTSNLGELLAFNVSPETAEILSGHSVSNVQGSKEHLFIWVLAPQNPNQAVPATWNNIFTRIPKEWMKGEPACP